jgi:hypothetical protein
VTESEIAGVVDWPRQQDRFEADGALRDIYVVGTTIEDWNRVVASLVAEYQATVLRDEVPVPVPDLAALFDSDERPFHLRLSVGGLLVTSHFFTDAEIEFDFWPQEVTESSLRDLLVFMSRLGELTQKLVAMTPENMREYPFFTYDPKHRELRYTQD